MKNIMVDDETYKRLLSKIQDILIEQCDNGNVLSYAELGQKLNVSAEMVFSVIGRRFTELTNKAVTNIYDDADPDFYLFGDRIKEISTNKMYQYFKKRKQKALRRQGKFLEGINKI